MKLAEIILVGDVLHLLAAGKYYIFRSVLFDFGTTVPIWSSTMSCLGLLFGNIVSALLLVGILFVCLVTYYAGFLRYVDGLHYFYDVQTKTHVFR